MHFVTQVRQIAEQKKAEREALKLANKIKKDEEMALALERCREKAAATAEAPLEEGEVIEKIHGTKGYYCRVCDVEMNSEQTMRTHEGGSKHSIAMGTSRKFARPGSRFAKRPPRNNTFEQAEEFRPREYTKVAPPSNYRQERKTAKYRDAFHHNERPPRKQRRWDNPSAPKSPEPIEPAADNLSDGEIMSDDDSSVVSVNAFEGKRYVDVEDEFRPREKRRRRRRSETPPPPEDKRRRSHSSPRRERRERKKQQRAKRSPTPRSPSPSPPPTGRAAARHDRMAEEFLNSVVPPPEFSSSRRRRQTSSISSSRCVSV